LSRHEAILNAARKKKMMRVECIVDWRFKGRIRDQYQCL